MGTTQARTGSSGILQLAVNEVGYDAGSNTSQVNVVASIYTPSGTYDYDNLSVSLSGGINWGTGSWSFDSSGGWHTLYSGTVTVGHNADGTGSFGVTFSLNSNTGTSGVGGPASVGNSIGLTTLTVPPGTPYGLTAARSTDSLINLAWSRSYASNGVPSGTSIQQQVNGGGWTQVASSGNIASASVPAAANQKLIYQVLQSNGAGSSGWSASSAPVWTTPAAPSVCTATKQGTGSILVSWTNNAAYAEYGTEVWHGTVAGGVTTWDASPLTTAASGVASYTHTGPNPAVVHVYQVRAVTTSGTVLQSSYATSNTVQLLIAPNAPTVATLPQFADKAVALAISWAHNTIDSTAQTAYELQRSTDGGTTWTSTGRTTSTASIFTIAASTYAANVALQVQVRTWGQANTGGSEGTGASPWSTVQTVTFKTAPTLAITAPTSGTGLAQAHATVSLSFGQAEAATPVGVTVTLLQGVTVLETVNTTTLTGIPLATRLADGSTYTIAAVVTDSNGLTGTAPSQTFAVNYAAPAAATIAPEYDIVSGMAQLVLSFPAPVGSEVAAATFTLTRTILGTTETLVSHQAVAGPITMVDTTPTINGTNIYAIITYSGDGAASAPVTADMVTGESRWAFLSTGDGYASAVKFYGDLKLGSTPARDATLVMAAGRSKPISLFGQATALDVDVTATIVIGDGSTPEEIEAFLLTAGLTCLRDPSGRRVFGVATGSLANRTPYAADLTLKVSEAQ